MTHVVTSACVDHKYQDCVAVCPVEAFREKTLTSSLIQMSVLIAEPVFQNALLKRFSPIPMFLMRKNLGLRETRKNP